MHAWCATQDHGVLFCATTQTPPGNFRPVLDDPAWRLHDVILSFTIWDVKAPMDVAQVRITGGRAGCGATLTRGSERGWGVGGGGWGANRPPADGHCGAVLCCSLGSRHLGRHRRGMCPTIASRHHRAQTHTILLVRPCVCAAPGRCSVDAADTSRCQRRSVHWHRARRPRRRADRSKLLVDA